MAFKTYFLDFFEQIPRHMQEEQQVKWEIEVQQKETNKLIASMSVKELLDRNKDYKAADLPSEEQLQAIKEAKQRDIDFLAANMYKDRSSGPTYKVKE